MTRENIPDLLAWFRLLSSPVILFLIIADGSDEGLMLVPAVIAFIAAWTDYFDGKLARKWNVSSKTGAFLDTIADKTLSIEEGATLKIKTETHVINKFATLP